MRTILFAVALLLLPALLNAVPIEVENLVAQAENAYSQGNYEQALALYDSVNTTHTSAGLLFNIGNCHSKMGNVAKAILFYERAIRLSPGADDIQANLDMERAKVVDRINALPAFTLGTLWERLRGGRDVDQWARRSLWACALMALAAMGALIVRAKALRRALLLLAAGLLAVTLLSTALAAYRVHEVKNHNEAIIMVPSADILGEPRKGATRLFILHKGTKVGLMKQEQQWQEVRLPSGAVGWILQAQIETI